MKIEYFRSWKLSMEYLLLGLFNQRISMHKVLVFTLLSIFSFPLWACSCADIIPSPHQVLEDSHSVFLGIPTQTSQTVSVSGSEVYRTKFRVVRRFKRAWGKTVPVYSDIDTGANCGIAFDRDDAVYLVRTNHHLGRSWTSICSVNWVKPENDELTRLIRELTTIR